MTENYDALIDRKVETKIKWTRASEAHRLAQVRIRGELSAQYPDRMQLHAAVQVHPEVIEAYRDQVHWFEEHQRSLAENEKTNARLMAESVESHRLNATAQDRIACQVEAQNRWMRTGRSD